MLEFNINICSYLLVSITSVSTVLWLVSLIYNSIFLDDIFRKKYCCPDRFANSIVGMPKILKLNPFVSFSKVIKSFAGDSVP